MTDYVQVLTTVDSAEDAERLGRGIVGTRLAACVQIVGPIQSLYWWQNKVEDAQEWQLLVKTATARLPELEQHIKTNHTYDEFFEERAHLRLPLPTLQPACDCLKLRQPHREFRLAEHHESVLSDS